MTAIAVLAVFFALLTVADLLPETVHERRIGLVAPRP
jgi:hypothetical protein